MNRRKSDGKCFTNAFFWLLFNAILGLAPLMFLLVLDRWVLNDERITRETEILLEGGMILFVSCALMGSVIVDIIISRLKFRNVGFFFIYISPFILLTGICIFYLLMILEHLNRSTFTSFSGFYIFVIIFSIIYCTLGKYLLYKSENT